MKKQFLCWLSLLLSCTFLLGCSHRPAQEEPPSALLLVTSIQVNCLCNGECLPLRQYTQSHKIRSVLDYLRLLGAYGSLAEVPSRPEDLCFEITLTRSDGSQKQYWQLANRYLKESGQPWKYIDEEKGAQLKDLLEALESDT